MQPKINTVLFLQVNSIDEEEAQQELKSRIADISDDTIVMEVPLNEKSGRLKRLYAGDELSVYFLTEGGVKHYFSTSVLGFSHENVPLVLIKKPEPVAIAKEQRRNFLRVPAELELSVKSEKLQFLALTEDVGGGGISFLCDKSTPMQVGESAMCWLLVPYRNGKVDHVPFRGEIVRLKPLELDRQLVMLRFIDIADKERQKLIRFCFERQFDFRKH